MRTIDGTQAPPERTGRFSLTRNLIGGSWTACVDAIETAMWRFKDEHSLASDCTMAFFEIAADETLHVNVTHRHRTKRIRGWTGPGHTADGFVYNRTFDRTPTSQILRHVRDMVFAARA
jgi:hypothetical protein